VAREPEDGELLAPVAGEAELFVREFGRSIRAHAGGTANPLVEVRGAGAHLVVRLRDLEEWFRADSGPTHTGVALLDADGPARARGAVSVVSLHWSEPGTLTITKGGPLASVVRRLRHLLGFW
jgi:hypothetical protein